MYLKRCCFPPDPGVEEVQPAHVDALYRKETQQYRITSILIEKENDARAFEAAVRRGRRFRRPEQGLDQSGKAHQGDQGN